MKWTRIAILWAAFFALNIYGFCVNAQGTSKPMLIGGGLLCDTLEQAIEQIETSPRADFVDGCGRLDGRFPATVTPLAVFETKGFKFPMVRFDFLVPTPWGNDTQYGFWGKPIKIAGDNI